MDHNAMPTAGTGDAPDERGGRTLSRRRFFRSVSPALADTGFVIDKGFVLSAGHALESLQVRRVEVRMALDRHERDLLLLADPLYAEAILNDFNVYEAPSERSSAEAVLFLRVFAALLDRIFPSKLAERIKSCRAIIAALSRQIRALIRVLFWTSVQRPPDITSRQITWFLIHGCHPPQLDMSHSAMPGR